MRYFPILQKYSHVPNIVNYELCGSATHIVKKCLDLDALVDRLDHYVFRVDDAPQGFGVGHRGGGGFRGGQNSGRGLVRYYKCEDKEYLERDCPLLSISWCTHCRNNTHATDECPDLIAKWEYCIRKRGTNLINS